MATFLTAAWRKLIMAQYDVAPGVLAPYLPRGVELDYFQDRCCVSLVGFLFDRVRVKGIAIPRHTRFEEVNLRFYVKRTEADGSLRRGVVFVREFVPRHAITFVARTFYDEPYETVPTRSEIETRPGALHVQYGWEIGERWHTLSAVAEPEPQHMPEGSEEEFLTEHYWGYTKRRDGSTSAYEVRHPRWQTYRIQTAGIQADFGAMYGRQWEFLNATPVASVLLAEGSPVSVMDGARLA